MTIYTQVGASVFLSNEMDQRPTYKKLPVATYSVVHDPINGFYLTTIPDFENPSKLYGDCEQKAERFLSTFADRKGTTGVLLAGAKGSGKSLVMKVTSTKGLERDIPTLVINAPYCGDAFNQFIQAIEEEAILIFDEFEKVYDDEHQERLLTLLDGTFTTKKLVIMTCNSIYKINQHMTNRPGRLYYYLKYSGLDEKFIREYCHDRLNELNVGKTESVVTLASLIYEFNFDMLKALVEELNRYNEEVKEAVEILNISYDKDHRVMYDVKVLGKDGTPIETTYFHPAQVYNPVNNDEMKITFYTANPLYEPENEDSDEEESVSNEVTVTMHGPQTKIKSDLSEIVASTDEYIVIFTKKVAREFDYTRLL